MSDPRDHKDAYIPADDVILRGYCGPIRVFHPTVREWELTTYAWGRVIFGDRVVPADWLTMKMPWEEAQARDNAARVMAAGVRCSACKGTGKNGTLPAPDSPRDLPCYDCDGSGYLLPPADIDPLIDSNRGHRLTPAQSAVFVADAYTRWRRGLPIPSVVRCSGTPLPDSMTRHYCIAANGTVTTPDLPTDRSHK